MSNWFRLTENYIYIDVKITPGASKNEFTQIKDNRLCVRIAAPPEDGKANACLCEFLAKTLSCAKRDAVIVKGEKSRQKTISIPVEFKDKLTKINLTKLQNM